MKVKYVGKTFEDDFEILTNGHIYECSKVDKHPYDKKDKIALWVKDNTGVVRAFYPDSVKPIYAKETYGHWEIVEDDEKGTLKKLIPQTVNV